MIEQWLFTFGFKHKHPNTFVRFEGTHSEAREKMIAKYGSDWAFQYASDKEEILKSYGIFELEEKK